jgi:hypothetical protein
MRHGVCANCIVVDGESRENFLILLQQHVDRFQPADEVEFGMIEEMCAAYWRQRRAWSLETGMLNKQMALQPDAGMTDQMLVAFDTLAASHSLSLLHRYETRLHLTYQRALRTLIMLRTIDRPNEDRPNEAPPNDALPNDPSPISEHPPDAMDPPHAPPHAPPPPPQPSTDSKPLGRACFGLDQPSPSDPPVPAAPAASHVPAEVRQASWPVASGPLSASSAAINPCTPTRSLLSFSFTPTLIQEKPWQSK